ncbi:MAG TPA: protein kinase [Terracidiphilus sp.]|nr:protein kinase [Terracidiphilus sp.]
MNDPKEQKYKPEATTLVVSNGVSASPDSGASDPAASTPAAQAASSEPPTILDSGKPPLAAAAAAKPSAEEPTLPPGAPVRLTGVTDITISGAQGAALQPGSIFANRYQIIKILGEGGMGAVYKARDIELARDVALKVIRPELSNNPEILERFKQELILARQVTDRNIIRIFDLGEAAGIRFITMEYVEGQNLHQLLKQQGKLPIAEAVNIMEQVAAGLSAAHREGIIHRDLKPGNIMRDVNGRVVVMDFGLARTISGDGMTRTGAMLGTMEYMSPEQAHGKELKASSDIFTAGLILYELLAGVAPFQAESAIASLLMRTQQRAVPLVEIDKNIPGSLSNIVAKCLEKDPANRYQSAEELDADLRAWQGRSGGKKVSVTSAQMLMNRLRELPWKRVAVTGALVLAVAAGLAWFFSRRQQVAKSVAHAPVSVLVADFTNLTGDPLLDNTIEPMIGEALEGASFVNVFGRVDALKVAAKLPHPTNKLDEQTARLVAQSQDVNVVVIGEINLRGGEYDISAVALDAVSGNVLAKSEVTVANQKEILSSLPRLAVPIRNALGDSTPASVQFDEVAGGFKAASLEAVHQASIAVDEQFAGKFQESFDSFQKAAAMDPNFTWGYTGMAAMAENLGRPGDAVKYMKQAMEHVDDMTDRERYRDRGLYYRTTGEWQECVQEYTQLIDHYPADRVGLNNLAICYLQIRNAPEALKAAQRAVQIVPKAVSQRLTLSFISAFAGDFAGSERDARTALSINPSAPQGYLVLAEAQLGQGQVGNATASYKKLESFGPAATSTATDGLGDLAAYQGRYADAIRIVSQGAAADLAAKNSDSAARKYVALGNIEASSGFPSAAISDTDKALAQSQDPTIQFLAGRTYAETGEFTKAQRLAASLSSALTAESQSYGKIITGLIALKKKDTNEAIRQFRAANGLLDTWISHFDLGRAYLDAGAFTEADSEFDQCIKRRGEAIELFDDNVPTYEYFPPVYYYEGRAREGMKSPGFADFYKDYLNIRGQSSDDSLVADIKHRLGQ